jgi:flagellar motor switch/type III secretory pathway protein FliN
LVWVEPGEERAPIFLFVILMAEPAAVAPTQSAEAVEPDVWVPVLTLPCKLTVDLPLPGFTVADALRLQPNSVINSRWRVSSDLALRLNGEVIARGEFEVAGRHLALRLTDLI